MQSETYETQVGGATLSATFTDLADQTNGSVLLRLGNTTVLVTAVMGRKDRSDIDYFPLSVEYEERFYAAGQILGSRFARREGRPSDNAILSGRIVDRTVRPLFDSALRKDVQVVVTVLSIDEDDPDVPAVNGASIALLVSDIPWAGPVSAVRVGKKKGSDAFVINPTYTFRKEMDTELDLLVCGKDGVVTMIEVAGKEIPEGTLVAALEAGMKEIEKMQEFQKMLAAKVGKTKRDFPKAPATSGVAEAFQEFEKEFPEAIFSGQAGGTTINALKDKYLLKVLETLPNAGREAGDYFEHRLEQLMRDRAIDDGARVDGRKTDEVRTLFAQAGGISPILHGSGIFYRGGTHVFSALTLGGPDASQIIDSIEGADEKKRFMHHYNFPPFSGGETGRFGGLNRRMVGHGALAEKALEPVIPSKESFPYTIRLVSESLASNGSTSMASVCASTLALMDGGVPIIAPVAGIAMGVMYDSPARYRILTDIQGPEDHHGDMDFKVAGTRNGVTAIQLDVKVEGLPVDILAEALEEAKKARLSILAVMERAIAAPRADISPRAPKIVSLSVPPDLIGMVIGPGGKNIKKIQEESGADGISIEDDGSVFVTGKGDAPERAAAMIREMTRVWKAGDIAEGPVTRIMNFGAFVRIGGKTEGLVHISELAPFRIARVEDAVAIGEVVKVVVKEIDQEGRVNLSIKAVDPDFAARKGLTPGPEGGDYHGRPHHPRKHHT